MTHRTCVSIAEDTPKKLERVIKKALKKSDLLELRLDFLDPLQVPDALSVAKRHMKNSVCTLRPKSEGGRFSGSEKERISILKLVAEHDPFLLDVEFGTLKKNRHLADYLESARTNVLVSWHDFESTPSEKTLKRRLAEMSILSNNVKIVTTANSLEDSARVLGLYKNLNKTNLIAFSMGEKGRTSRILCLYLGSPYTYVSLGKPVAPGQFSVDELKKLQGQNRDRHSGKETA